MKMMIKTAMTIAATFTLVSTANAEVANIAPETFAQYGQDEAYFVAEVSCTQGGATRAIQRKTDGNEWCGKDVAGNCGVSKDEAAKKVCSAEYDSALSSAEDKIKAEKEAAAAQARAKKAEQDRAAQARKEQQDRARAEAERKKKAAAAAAAPLKKKISIEEQLIKIEQEKLDLRRQELELQRRAVEIQKLLDKKG